MAAGSPGCRPRLYQVSNIDRCVGSNVNQTLILSSFGDHAGKLTCIPEKTLRLLPSADEITTASRALGTERRSKHHFVSLEGLSGTTYASALPAWFQPASKRASSI